MHANRFKMAAKVEDLRKLVENERRWLVCENCSINLKISTA